VSGFKRKPLDEDNITEALRAHTAHIPSTTGHQPIAGSGAGQGRERAPKTVQINFNASEAMARLVAQEAAKLGSTRKLFAKLLKDAGHDIPEADLPPLMNKRRWE
jgi:hypothetical protein